MESQYPIYVYLNSLLLIGCLIVWKYISQLRLDQLVEIKLTLNT